MKNSIPPSEGVGTLRTLFHIAVGVFYIIVTVFLVFMSRSSPTAYVAGASTIFISLLFPHMFLAMHGRFVFTKRTIKIIDYIALAAIIGSLSAMNGLDSQKTRRELNYMYNDLSRIENTTTQAQLISKALVSWSQFKSVCKEDDPNQVNYYPCKFTVELIDLSTPADPFPIYLSLIHI